ncbi:MAG: hypothetical protein ABI680_02325 [Chthoniobacteraceae bacterium]
MKTSEFEENFSAWLEGGLSTEEAATLEKEMTARGFDPIAERREAQQLSTILRQHSTVPVLDAPDFFNHQILHRLENEAARPQSRMPKRAWWTLPRFAWAGAFCLLIATILYQALVVNSQPVALDRTPYFAKVIDARPLAPHVSADTVYTDRDKVTVVWLAGLDNLPADYQL